MRARRGDTRIIGAVVVVVLSASKMKHIVYCKILHIYYHESSIVHKIHISSTLENGDAGILL